MATNPIYNWPAEDIRTETRGELRGKWLEVMDGLIQAAIRGNVQAFLVLREEAWGIPISGVKQNLSAISLEELISIDDRVTRPAASNRRGEWGDYDK